MIYILPLPPTTNHMYGRKGKYTFLTPQARTWKTEAQWRMKVLHAELLARDVGLNIMFYLKFDRDVDNLKLLLDSMKGILFADDAQVIELHIYKFKDKDNPRVEISVL